MPQFDRAVVEEIKALDVRRCEEALAQGDKVLALIPIGDRGQDNGSAAELEALAQETGIDAGTLRNRRFVASRIPNELRSSFVTFSAYAEAAQASDVEREALLTKLRDTRPTNRSGRWTVDLVRTEMGREPRSKNPIARVLQKASPSDAAGAFASALERPSVAEAFAAAALAPDSAPARALAGLNDLVVEQRLEEALDQPTVPMATVEDRVRQAQQENAPYQYDRLKQTLSAFFARYAAAEVAEAITASPHTDRMDLYLEGADQVIAWFQQFRQTLAAGSRPRLVVPAESAS